MWWGETGQGETAHQDWPWTPPGDYVPQHCGEKPTCAYNAGGIFRIRQDAALF